MPEGPAGLLPAGASQWLSLAGPCTAACETHLGKREASALQGTSFCAREHELSSPPLLPPSLSLVVTWH